MPRITEVVLRITQSDDCPNGDPRTWDWTEIMDSDHEQHFEMVSAHDPTGATPKYLVGVCEVHVSTMEVEASSPEEALERADERLGRELKCEYSHTLPRDTWTINKIGG